MFAPGCAAHECRLSLGKREDRIDLGPQVAGVGEPGQLEQLFTVGLHDEVVGARCLGGDRHDPTCLADGARQCLAPYGVEQQVARLSLLHQRRAPAAGELHGHMPDTTVRARDADALTGLQPAMDNQRLPGAEAGHGQRRRLDVAERTRLGREHLHRDERVVGCYPVAVKRREREHVFTGREPVAVLDDDARQLMGGDRG